MIAAIPGRSQRHSNPSALSNTYILVAYFPKERIDPEIVDVLDQIVSVASQANPIR
ncbi:MAG: hypothetical protein LW850_16415 [Planctomycetaceae bacterium]|nr:hypothetical protein [Planctomycetaceae bacterium]